MTFFFRKKRHQEKMESMSWKVSYNDLDFKTARMKGSSFIGSKVSDVITCEYIV